MHEKKIDARKIKVGFVEGKWVIDQVLGKVLVKVVIECDDWATQLSVVPKDEFFLECVDKKLEAEWRNDYFTFVKGVRGSRRPAELEKKIDTFQKVLDKWKKKMKEVGS